MAADGKTWKSKTDKIMLETWNGKLMLSSAPQESGEIELNVHVMQTWNFK